MRTGSASLLVHGPAHPRHRMRRNDELGQLFETSSIAPNTGISSLGTVHASGCDRHKYKAMLGSSSTILTLASICWVSTDRHRLRRGRVSPPTCNDRSDEGGRRCSRRKEMEAGSSASADHERNGGQRKRETRNTSCNRGRNQKCG